MMTKKMTRDEAEKLMEKCRDSLEMRTYFRTEGDEVQLCEYSSSGKVVARFPFEPPHPELIIGDTHKFWDDNGDWAIGKLTDKDDSHAPYEMEGCTWYQHAEPYTLIDPAEHARLKKENAALKEVLAKQHIFVKNK